MKSDKKVLIITNHYPEKIHGGAFVSKAFINAVGECFTSCKLIFPADSSEIPAQIPLSVIAVPCIDRRPKTLKGLEVYFGKLHRFYSLASELIRIERFDYVFFDSSVVSSGLMRKCKRKAVKVITLHHNCEADYVRDNPPSILFRIPYKFYIRKAEKIAVNKSDLNLTLTEHDRERLSSLYKISHSARISVLGISAPGTDTNDFALSRRKINGPVRFIITGNLNFPQSEKSILNFVSDFWPEVLKRKQDAILVIAGANPGKNVKKLTNLHRSIQVVANPESLDTLVSASDIYVCPVDSGSGFKMRILDGLRNGKPVITHINSSHGYEELVKRGGIKVYDSKEAFIDALESTLNTEFNSAEIIDIYRNVFSFSRLVANLKEVTSHL